MSAEFEHLMSEYGYIPLDERGRTLRDYWLAPANEAADPIMNMDWQDKPHRVLYDLIKTFAQHMQTHDNQKAM